MTSGHMLQQLESEMTRATERVSAYRQELERLVRERSEQQSIISSRAAEIAAAEASRAELERVTTSMQEQFTDVRRQREAAAQNASQHLARVATLEERHRSAAAVLQRIESVLAEMRERVSTLASQIDSSAAERQQRENDNQSLADHLLALEAERNASEAREGLLQVESEQVRARLAEIEEALRQARSLLDQARDRRAEISTALAKLQSDAQHMRETCLNELNIEREELMADSTLSILSGEQLSTEDQAYRELRTKLDVMGPVNMMALEEYRETAERHTFLETQRKDLLESIDNTLATIREIDTFSRHKFQEAFEKINENFQTTFRKLFGGGHAFMRLTDEENSAESGIDVVASPPGKKLQNVLLLSGGEKALTALALLVGIFRYQPSPFCILDEVDAPLDEANIGRFTELVQEMSIQTQFVLITHSKKTMSIAPVLYGVTMQEPGVSKLVSVKFGATA